MPVTGFLLPFAGPARPTARRGRAGPATAGRPAALSCIRAADPGKTAERDSTGHPAQDLRPLVRIMRGSRDPVCTSAARPSAPDSPMALKVPQGVGDLLRVGCVLRLAAARTTATPDALRSGPVRTKDPGRARHAHQNSRPEVHRGTASAVPEVPGPGPSGSATQVSPHCAGAPQQGAPRVPAPAGQAIRVPGSPPCPWYARVCAILAASVFVRTAPNEPARRPGTWDRVRLTAAGRVRRARHAGDSVNT
jgi:hypothetical protein